MLRSNLRLWCLAFSLLGSIAAARSPAADGPVVLLANGRLLPGVAQQQGEIISVRDGDAEVRIPMREVLCWGPDVRAVYQYRVDQRPPGSLAAQLQDIDWCLDNGLLDLAARELMDVSRQAPDHPVARALERRLRLAAPPPTASRPTSDPSPTASERAVVSERAVAVPTPEPDEPSELDAISADLLLDYTAAIQPILMNRCAGCHDRRTETGLRLLRLSGTRSTTAAMTRANLRQVLRWIDTDNPAQSDLLTKAFRPHGGDQQPPLDAADRQAGQRLREWILRTGGVGTDPVAENTGLATGLPATSPDASTVSSLHPASAVPTREPAARQGPVRLPSVDDPFDPAIFNRRFHPQRTGRSGTPVPVATAPRPPGGAAVK